MNPFCSTRDCFNLRTDGDHHCQPCKAEKDLHYYQRSEERRQRCSARARAKHALKMHWISRQPCEICLHPVAEMHHEDYDKPLEVRWLCDDHHQMVTNNDVCLLPPWPLTAKDIIRNVAVMRAAAGGR